MTNKCPDVDPKATFNVKETCYHLDINKDTLSDRRNKGMITPVNANKYRYRYSGAAIRKLWHLENPGLR